MNEYGSSAIARRKNMAASGVIVEGKNSLYPSKKKTKSSKPYTLEFG